MNQENRRETIAWKRAFQKQRRAWKQLNPELAEAKHVADLMDSERRAVKRGDREMVRELRVEKKRARWMANSFKRSQRAIVKSEKPEPKRAGRNWMARAFNSIFRPSFRRGAPAKV